MKSIKKMTDDVIDLAIEGMYSEIEEDHDEDGHHIEVNLSPKPELYDKLHTYFAEMYVDVMIDTLKNYFNQQKQEASGR